MEKHQELLSLVQALCQKHSVSGAERHYGFTTTVMNFFRESGLTATTDPIGNVVASLGNGELTILFEAHGDEVGLMVTSITPRGQLRFVCVGSSSPAFIVNQPIDVLNPRGNIPGLITLLHGSSEITLPDLAIEVGTSSREETEQLGIKVSDLVGFRRHCQLLANATIVSPGLDNKAGVAALIRAAQLLSQDERRQPPHTKIVFAITAQHEQGNHRGIDIVMNQQKPDLAIVVDSAYAQPLPSLPGKTQHWSIPKIGRGPAIEPLGQGFCLNRTVFDFLVSVATNHNVPFQFEIPDCTAGGTDISAIYNRLAGVPTGVINIPVRFQHTPVTMANLQDIEDGAQWLALLVAESQGFIEQKWRIQQ